MDHRSPSRLPSLALLALLVFSAGAEALDEPNGDLHPVILIEDGSFAVYSQLHESGRDAPHAFYKRTHAVQGELLLPRHRLSAERARELEQHLEKWHSGRTSAETHVETGEGGPFVYCQAREGKISRRPLPVDCPDKARIASSLTTSTEVGFLWSQARAGSKDAPAILRLSTAALEGFAPGLTVEIGHPAFVDEAPAVSHLVWTSGRWWVAWVRDDTDAGEAGDGNKSRAYHTILSSIEPVTGKVVHHALPGISGPDADLSLATHNGWLCVAWSANLGTLAEIVTAFYHIE